MTKPANIHTIEKQTNRSWAEWLAFFADIGAQKLTHTEIARAVEAEIHDSWWAQTITVAYEQYIGRREPGQQSNGEFEVSVSKSILGTMDEVFNKWQELIKEKTVFNGVTTSNTPKLSKTEKWRHWRIPLTDGSTTNVAIYQKTPEKAQLSVTQSKLASSKDIEPWRAFWKTFLEDL